MYVCICQAVTDTQILDAVDSGARDLYQVSEQLGAGTCCGSCRELAQELITKRLDGAEPFYQAS